MTDKALWAFSDTSGNCSNTISLCEATKEDAPFIASVYNQAILAGNCTCDTKTVTSEMREMDLSARYRWLSGVFMS